MPDKSTSFNRLDYTFKLFVVIALTITATILAKEIVIPLAFAGFLSIVMLPLIKKLEKRNVPTAIAIILVLTVTVIIMGLLGWLIVDQIVRLINDLPNLQNQLEDFTQKTSQTLSNRLNVSISKQNQMMEESMKNVGGFLGNALVSTSTTLSTLIQIPIYIFLFLIYRNKFQEFLLSLVDDEKMAWKDDIEKVVQGYISGLTLVTLIIIVLNTIGLFALGIEHAIFFGVLSGVLTIIPYVGIIIGAVFPILMALITKDSVWYAIGVIIVFTVVQFLEGNFITPKITGSKVSINALAAILALLIGGKILGIAGMILAVPAIGITKIILSRSRRLKSFVILLEDVEAEEKRSAEEKLEQKDSAGEESTS